MKSQFAVEVPRSGAIQSQGIESCLPFKYLEKIIIFSPRCLLSSRSAAPHPLQPCLIRLTSQTPQCAGCLAEYGFANVLSKV